MAFKDGLVLVMLHLSVPLIDHLDPVLDLIL